jgi:hypothetical protein
MVKSAVPHSLGVKIGGATVLLAPLKSILKLNYDAELWRLLDRCGVAMGLLNYRSFALF